MITTREDIVTRFRAIVGENDSEDVTKLIEDISDTVNNDGYKDKYEEMKQKYEDNDKTWREKYRARFEQPIDPQPDPDPEPEVKKYTFESLFKEG